jgi:hypothetical protein
MSLWCKWESLLERETFLPPVSWLEVPDWGSTTTSIQDPMPLPEDDSLRGSESAPLSNYTRRCPAAE